MTVLAVFLIFLFVLFCINYTIASAILYFKKPKQKPISFEEAVANYGTGYNYPYSKHEWEKSIEKEIKRVLQY